MSAEALHSIRNLTIPVVFLNQPAVAGKFPSINVDYQRGFREAIGHLQLFGHERIAFISGPNTLSSAVQRKMDFLTVAKDCGLELKKEWILEGDHKMTGGKIAAARFFTMNAPPSAVVCSNDLTAIGFLHTASRLNRKIPGEVSLIGVDDIVMSEVVQPALTTLHISRREIATHAFYALHNGEAAPARISNAIVLPQLVIRESTGPHRDALASPRERIGGMSISSFDLCPRSHRA